MSDVPRLLIIDNDPGLLEAIHARLEATGYECSCAHTGAQGLALFQEQRFDLVVTDLNMPNGDGMSVITRIRERDERVPIVVVTGFKDAYRRSLRNVKDITTIRKPFDSQDLVSLIHNALERAGSVTPTESAV
jgi:DNA-binding response OmpR family regulator